MNDTKAILNIETGEEIVIELTDAEQAIVNAQRAQAALDRATQDVVDSAKQANRDEVRGQKAQTAIDKLVDDLAKIDTATATERLAMQKRTMTYLLAVIRLLKDEND